MTPTPEEPPNGQPEGDGPDGHHDEIDAPLRGWISPDDRLWRHPSELSADPSTPALAPPAAGAHGRIMLLVGAVAALAAVAWVVVLLSPPTDHAAAPPASTGAADGTLSTLAVNTRALPPEAGAASQAMVQLHAVTSHGVVSMVGVAVAEGGLVATTADGLDGLRRLVMIGADGHQERASVVAIDAASDLALVNVPDDVPVAPFADDVALGDGSAALTLSMTAPAGTTPALHGTPGLVTAVGGAIEQGRADGMPGITTSAPVSAAQAGDPLLNTSGAVVGILYSTVGPGAPVFLPSALVLGVTDDLRSSGRVAHGWLGVEGHDAPGTSGAQVASLMSGSPAAGRLQAGDVIEEMDSVPIRTMAELRAELYVLNPATTVALAVLDGTTTRVVDVTLSASP
ncbi:MAG TPA: trypsin-like peptidase domain-containing protein [Acidimicrobiales bacterium]